MWLLSNRKKKLTLCFPLSKGQIPYAFTSMSPWCQHEIPLCCGGGWDQDYFVCFCSSMSIIFSLQEGHEFVPRLLPYMEECVVSCARPLFPLFIYTPLPISKENGGACFFRLLISIATFLIRHPDHIASITSCLGKQQRERARQLFLFSDPCQLPTCCRPLALQKIDGNPRRWCTQLWIRCLQRERERWICSPTVHHRYVIFSPPTPPPLQPASTHRCAAGRGFRTENDHPW
jgi:hypothetical protein